VKFEVAIDVMPRKEISDPQGQTIERALPTLGFDGVETVRVGKRITLTLESDSEEEARDLIEKACQRFLTNPQIEQFSYTLNAMQGAT
jgi:phosphoribosylformylglycinamidine synthase PurS subunit